MGPLGPGTTRSPSHPNWAEPPFVNAASAAAFMINVAFIFFLQKGTSTSAKLHGVRGVMERGGGSQRSSGVQIGSVRFVRRSDWVGRRHSVPSALAPGVPTATRGKCLDRLDALNALRTRLTLTPGGRGGRGASGMPCGRAGERAGRRAGRRAAWRPGPRRRQTFEIPRNQKHARNTHARNGRRAGAGAGGRGGWAVGGG